MILESKARVLIKSKLKDKRSCSSASIVTATSFFAASYTRSLSLGSKNLFTFLPWRMSYLEYSADSLMEIPLFESLARFISDIVISAFL